jgi:hypothetical protein
MGARRERQHDETPEQSTRPTVSAPSSVALPAAGFSPQTLNRAGVIALQRLVGNAAVVEMMQAGERPEREDPEVQEADRPGAGGAETQPGTAVGDVDGAGGDLCRSSG